MGSVGQKGAQLGKKKPCSNLVQSLGQAFWNGGTKKGLRSRIVPNCTLSQDGYGDISGRKRCQVIVRSMQFDSGQCDAVGQENEKGQKLAARLAPQSWVRSWSPS